MTALLAGGASPLAVDARGDTALHKLTANFQVQSCEAQWALRCHNSPS